MRIFLALLGTLWAFSGAQAVDLDDLDIPYVRQPLEGVTTGGQPAIEDLERLAGEGYHLIVNLRTPGEFDRFDEARVVEQLGMTYINIPVYGMQDITRENADKLHAAIEGAGGKVLLHCTIGMRAGALLALDGYMHHNLSKKEAIDLAERAHMPHMSGAVEDAIRRLDQ